MKYKKIIPIATTLIASLAVFGAVDTFAATANTEVTVTVNPIISLSLDSSEKATSLNSGATSTGVKTTASVSTNDLTGYTLTVADADSNTALTGTNGSIPTGTSINAGTSAWAIKGSSFPTGRTGDTTLSTTSWTAMVASGSSITVLNSATLSAAVSNEQSVIEYGVSTSNTQAAGTYSDTITFTATAKAS